MASVAAVAACVIGLLTAGVTPGAAAPGAREAGLSLARQVGQLIIATYPASVPPPSILAAVRAGRVGAIILMGANTDDSVAVTRRATDALQRAATAGGNPKLLIMTDQEGGEVKRLPGPPTYAADQMGSPALAGAQGYATALMLRRAGVNVDLAPVADVQRVDGFMAKQQRTFGTSPAGVAAAACAFARGLVRGGVGYTLKHFPGLGDALTSTDTGPVTVPESASEVEADDAAYRSCGRGRLAVVMVSSASYPSLTGDLPAVMAPSIYTKLMPKERIDALTISDALQTPAITRWPDAAGRAVAAGLDMAMYAGTEAGAFKGYATLLADARQGRLGRSRIAAAAAKVLALKQALGLTAAA